MIKESRPMTRTPVQRRVQRARNQINRIIIDEPEAQFERDLARLDGSWQAPYSPQRAR